MGIAFSVRDHDGNIIKNNLPYKVQNDLIPTPYIVEKKYSNIIRCNFCVRNLFDLILKHIARWGLHCMLLLVIIRVFKMTPNIYYPSNIL